jgi:hypothetical protein
MEKWVEKPRGFGEILDLTFLVLRKQFAKILLIMLILTGPILLIQAIAMISGGIPIIPGTGAEGLGTWESFLFALESTGIEQALYTVGGIELAILIVTLVLLGIVLVPVALAAIILLTGKVKNGETIEVGPIIKQAFSRYGALIGGTIVYMLILIALIALPFIVVPLLVFGNVDAGPGLIVAGVVLGLAYFFAVVYFITRWSFYFTAITFEKVSPGIAKSWRLTKGQFWRLVGLYIVLNIIVSIITYAFQLVSNLFLTGSVIGYLIYTIVSALSYVIMNVAYAVIYFDLRVRNEGADLEEMLESYYEKDAVVDHSPTNEEMLEDVQFDHEKRAQETVVKIEAVEELEQKPSDITEEKQVSDTAPDSKDTEK